ncbi:MAG TPA: acyl-CoA synthetase, partial [Acidimicrobiales bacterium]
SAGVMFSAEVKAALLEHLPNAQILDFIASTETAAGVSVARAGNVPPTGRFTPYPGVILVDDDGAVVPPGARVPGRLAVPGRFGGYRGDDAKTAAVTLEVDGAPYTLPGDVAVWEDDGTISLLGRGSACINTGGEKVFPEEVEEAAKRDPAVDDCLVFGVPDERFGQRVVAVVSMVGSDVGGSGPGGRPVDPASLVNGLLDRLRGELAAYKLPRAVVVLDRVPRTPSGKPDYAAARAELARRTGAASMPSMQGG